MNEVFLGTLALLGALLVIGHHVRLRRRGFERTLSAGSLRREANQLVTAAPLTLASGRLCRIALEVSLEGEYRLRPRLPFRKVAREIAPPCRLTLSDPSGRVLHDTCHRLERFMESFEWGDRGFALVEQTRWARVGTATLLELVPHQAMECHVAVALDLRAEVEAQHSSASCEVIEAKLTITEIERPPARSRWRTRGVVEI